MGIIVAGAAATTVRVLVVPIAMPLQGGRPERPGLLFLDYYLSGRH
jgi:hypothetical protein